MPPASKPPTGRICRNYARSRRSTTRRTCSGKTSTLSSRNDANKWERRERREQEGIGAPWRTRTSDLLVRSQTLYPTELRAREHTIIPARVTPRNAAGPSPSSHLFPSFPCVRVVSSVNARVSRQGAPIDEDVPRYRRDVRDGVRNQPRSVSGDGRGWRPTGGPAAGPANLHRRGSERFLFADRRIHHALSRDGARGQVHVAGDAGCAFVCAALRAHHR